MRFITEIAEYIGKYNERREAKDKAEVVPVLN
jgi:hypothetical protein